MVQKRTDIKVINWHFFVNPKCGIRTVNKLCNHLNTLPQKIFKGKKTFIIFRNPYNRLLSGYLNKYVQHTKYVNRGGLKTKDISTFKKFIQVIDECGIKILDKHHFSLQTGNIKNGNDNSEIFITEELHKLISYINEIIKKYDENLILDQKDYNYKKSKHNMNGSIKNDENKKKPYDLNRNELLELINKKELPSYDNFYTDEFKKIVNKLYSKDFNFMSLNNINYN